MLAVYLPQEKILINAASGALPLRVRRRQQLSAPSAVTLYKNIKRLDCDGRFCMCRSMAGLDQLPISKRIVGPRSSPAGGQPGGQGG